MSPTEKLMNEEIRLKKLQLLNILDTSPEKEFDDITLLAAQICNAPISTISFISSASAQRRAIQQASLAHPFAMHL